MLPRAGLRNNPLLAHPPSQQPLTQRIVDLVRPRMQQVLTLQIDLRPTALLRQPLRKIQRSRPPAVVLQQIIQLRLKRRILLRLLVGVLQLLQRRHQRLRNISPAIRPKPPRHCRRQTRRRTHRSLPCITQNKSRDS